MCCHTIQALIPQLSLTDLASAIVVNYVRLFDSEDKPAPDEDGVYLYAVEFLSLSILWHGFQTREMGKESYVWKVLLLAFKRTNHRKELCKKLSTYY